MYHDTLTSVCATINMILGKMAAGFLPIDDECEVLMEEASLWL